MISYNIIGSRALKHPLCS